MEITKLNQLMKYTALTIGPIHKTLQNVKSTKAIWAASYMFSYLMRKIIERADLNRENVILPFYEERDLSDKNKLGVGLFPDRLIYKGEIRNLKEIIDKVVTEFAKEVLIDIKENKKIVIEATENEVITFFKEYLNINYLDIELPESENIIFRVNSLLDSAELKQRTQKNSDKGYLNAFINYCPRVQKRNVRHYEIA